MFLSKDQPWINHLKHFPPVYIEFYWYGILIKWCHRSFHGSFLIFENIISEYHRWICFLSLFKPKIDTNTPVPSTRHVRLQIPTSEACPPPINKQIGADWSISNQCERAPCCSRPSDECSDPPELNFPWRQSLFSHRVSLSTLLPDTRWASSPQYYTNHSGPH